MSLARRDVISIKTPSVYAFLITKYFGLGQTPVHGADLFIVTTSESL